MAMTLSSLRDRVEQRLLDTSNAIWSTGVLDEGIRLALAEYSDQNPRQAIGTVTLAADGREVDISSLSSLLAVRRVWYDYNSNDPEEPPRWVRFEVWPGNILYIPGGNEPKTNEVFRVFYTAQHTIKDLDSAANTTIPLDHESAFVDAAAGYAATSRSIDLIEQVTMSENSITYLENWGNARLREWRAWLETIRPRLLESNPVWGSIGL